MSRNPLKYETHRPISDFRRDLKNLSLNIVKFGYQTVEKYDKDHKITIAVGSKTCLLLFVAMMINMLVIIIIIIVVVVVVMLSFYCRRNLNSWFVRRRW